MALNKNILLLLYLQNNCPWRNRSSWTSIRPWTVTPWTSRPCGGQLWAKGVYWRMTSEEKFGPNSSVSMCTICLPNPVSVCLCVERTTKTSVVSYFSHFPHLKPKMPEKSHKDYRQVVLDVRRSMRRFPKGQYLINESKNMTSLWTVVGHTYNLSAFIHFHVQYAIKFDIQNVNILIWPKKKSVTCGDVFTWIKKWNKQI